jgi:hypothetical protein
VRPNGVAAQAFGLKLFALIGGLYYGKKRTPWLTMALIERHFSSRKSTRHSGMVRKHQTSDVQLHIGES